MKNNIMELVFLLDRSGSMRGLESDTIGGFNAMIEKQKKQEGQVYVSTILFDNFVNVLHDRVPLEQIKPMTEEEYFVRGCTALIDAIGSQIRHISNVHKYIRPEDVPQHTMFVITTDGMENASHYFTADTVRKMIKEKQEEGWEFLFIGANIDAVETANFYGIGADRAVNYNPDSKGTKLIYDGVSQAVSQCRACAPLASTWKEDIERDFEERKSER